MTALFGLFIELFYLLSSTNQYFFTLYIMVQYFMTNIYHQIININISMMMGVVFFQKQKVRKLYNLKYQIFYSNQYYVLKNDHIKDTRIRQTYSRIKLWATCYFYLNGSPYHDAEVLSQLRQCLHNDIINHAPRIGFFLQIGIVQNVSTYKSEGHTLKRVEKRCLCMHLYYLYLNFEKFTQQEFFQDSNFSTKEKSECCGTIIDNISYSPICVLEKKDIRSKGALKNILMEFIDGNCIVEFALKVTAHDYP